MNDSEKWAQAWQQAAYDQLVQDMRPGAGPPGQGANPAVGGGIGNLSGWVVFFGMIGAVLGGILGRGLTGAVVGALVFGGAMWALGAFAGRAGNGAVSRASVVGWALKGAIAGGVLGVLIGLGDSVRMANAATNWALLGAILAGGYRLVRRVRT